jgi:hypothetical protein
VKIKTMVSDPADPITLSPSSARLALPFQNRKTKSDLGWAFIELIDGGRLKVYAKDGSDFTRIYRHQLAACTYEVLPGPGKLLRWSVPPSRGHYDLLISTALTARLDAIDWRDRSVQGSAGSRSARPNVSPILLTRAMLCRVGATVLLARSCSWQWRFVSRTNVRVAQDHHTFIPPQLTEEVIAEATARTDKVACSPGNSRCFVLPNPVAEVRKTCTPKGRCLIGGTRRVIIAEGGRTSYDAWLDLHTGEGRLRRRVE